MEGGATFQHSPCCSPHRAAAVRPSRDGETRELFALKSAIGGDWERRGKDAIFVGRVDFVPIQTVRPARARPVLTSTTRPCTWSAASDETLSSVAPPSLGELESRDAPESTIDSVAESVAASRVGSGHCGSFGVLEHPHPRAAMRPRGTPFNTSAILYTAHRG